MRTGKSTPRGRPKTSPLPRAEQLRAAKRAQRERDRARGLVLCQVKLPKRTGGRLRQALAVPGFQTALARFLDEAIIDVRRYPMLQQLCWNRTGHRLSARDALSLYERNWRFVDVRRLTDDEHALIRRLADRYGNGVLNA